jgi:hypothetical protein
MTAGRTPSRRLPRTRLEREQVFRRRRRVALALAAAVLLLVIWAVSALVGDDGGGASAENAKAPELPRGGRIVLPRYRLVAYYGAPQHDELGQLGVGTPDQAGRDLLDVARGYERPGRPVLPAFELIATLAQADPGTDGKYRLRQPSEVILRYLRAVRAIKGILILDVQPGQSTFAEEVKLLAPYLAQPDVQLALDPEWNLPTGHVPGKEIGSTDAATVNQISSYLARIRRAKNLPQKVLIVHQFTEGMVRSRDQVLDRPGVAIVHNVDGFGTGPIKSAVYDKLVYRVGAGAAGASGSSGATGTTGTTGTTGASGTGGSPADGRYNGFKLFFHEDKGLMKPAQVLALKPPPDVIVYE